MPQEHGLIERFSQKNTRRWHLAGEPVSLWEGAKVVLTRCYIYVLRQGGTHSITPYPPRTTCEECAALAKANYRP